MLLMNTAKEQIDTMMAGGATVFNCGAVVGAYEDALKNLAKEHQNSIADPDGVVALSMSGRMH